MSTDSQYLQGVLHSDIPLTREMGMAVIDWHDHCLRLQLPLAPNVNHKSTMFGGSLYCGAVLVGWGWLHLRLRELGIDDGHIVIQEGQISYPLPVTGTAVARCPAPDEKAWERFLTMYQRRGRARLTLETVVSNEGSDEAAVRFSGQYVLHR
ncbi:YiiD C-terminal domain-containing protein [Pseudomonas sichuanensis]|uniref:thioesterase domain-containing protein n=1 Tax=Pseudomonas sichuanensis TaxID=2213015 RepID=UPI00244A75DA|nr:YiiD C-terminal domain-containing protein [Pseudomonas sichuanensis]MDH0730519.1 YiiD C-terminal domain-containing protein [Pseudomonas sichuanensis]MDH1583266.1 YiiD C-terminal domain-containing protein [Pseudomonas sichuanensis]MDH1591655.1 YiiD C-terminal domain-containing protein [Pseudomonas sichuanensis]MDH1596455.1 YiiD C-terminal domain-containing protein [Pseudomonas sichuanensis]